MTIVHGAMVVRRATVPIHRSGPTYRWTARLSFGAPPRSAMP
jgi:hypothetical protein